MTDTSFLRGISLLSVHMHQCAHERGPGDLDGEPTVETEGKLQPMRVADDQLAFLVSLTYRFANAETDDPIATGSVTYAATYELADGLELSEEQVEVFGRQGALFQVHPFLREHLATMCQRSGLVPYPLPILLHDIAEEESGDEPFADGM